MKSTRSALALAALGLCAASTASATYSCIGTVDNVSVNPLGVVVISSAGATLTSVYICQIGQTTNGVAPEPCKAILSLLLTAQATAQAVEWDFSDSLTCSTHTAWGWLTGWYYGPVVMNH